MPGENIRVNVEALYVAEILEYLDEKKYFMVTVKEIFMDYGDKLETESYLRFVKGELTSFLNGAGTKLNKEVFASVLSMEDADVFVNTATYNITFKEDDKQKILSTFSVKEKLYAFYGLLVNEIEIAKLEKVISDKVRKSVEKSQKEFYLREQLKAIHNELGDDEEEEKNALEERIKNKKMPKEVEGLKQPMMYQ